MPTATLDALETDLEASLLAHAEGYRAAPLPKATLDAKAVLKLERERDELKELCDRLTAQLADLDRRGEIETARLHMNFEPLLQRLRLCDEALRICGVFSELGQRLARELAEVKEACVALAKQFLPNHLPKFEQGLEIFQDRCDALADQLDALENQGHDIAELVPGYEAWMAQIEQFSEILDERSEALLPKSG